jgi:short-subunit dehydrogenase
MSFESVVITGANRGIGLEFVKQLLSLSPQPKHIIATTRNKNSEQLQELAKNNISLHVLELDCKLYSSFDEFSSKVKQIVGSIGIDLLINNAGIAISNCNIMVFFNKT